MDDTARKRKLWSLRPHDRAAIDQLGRHLRVSPIVAQLLLNRDLGEPDAAQRFLELPHVRPV